MDAPDALAALFDPFLAWLRVLVTPTITRGELLFTPFVVVAFLFHLRNAVVMLQLWWDVRREGDNEDLGSSALDRARRAVRGMLRLLCWVAISVALLTNFFYTTIVFTIGLLLYAFLEAIDGALDWKYQRDREVYWKRKDALDDYAERVAAIAQDAVNEARKANDRAEEAVVLAKAQGSRLEAALAKNTALTEIGVQHAQAAYNKADEALESSNDTNTKIAALGQTQVDMAAQQGKDRVKDQADVAELKSTTEEIKVTTEETRDTAAEVLRHTVGDRPTKEGPNGQ